MGRNKNPLTGTQLNEEEFSKKVATIRQIGMRNLAAYGLISHETINNYCRRLAVAPASEERIDRSIERYKADQKQLGDLSLNRTRAVLAD